MSLRAMHKVSDRWFAALQTGVDASATTWVLSASGATGLPDVGSFADVILHCGTEKVLVTAVAVDTPSAGLDSLTVERGYAGSTAAPHLAEAEVGHFYYEDHHNDLAERLSMAEFVLFALTGGGNGVLQGGGALIVSAQDTPSLSVDVAGGAAIVGGQPVALRAATTVGPFVAPVTNPRIDLITIDQLGALAIVAGTEAASPTAPATPANRELIAEIYLGVGDTHIDDTDGGDGYIDLGNVTYL